MIFSVQRFVEDYLDRRNLIDGDQYAIRIADVYARSRAGKSKEDFLKLLRRIRTVLFKNYAGLNRDRLELDIIQRLDGTMLRQTPSTVDSYFQAGVVVERKRLQRMPRQSISHLLKSFRRCTQARSVDAIWVSRKFGRLHSRPEKIAQALFANFVYAVLINRPGVLLREVQSGVGFVDAIVMLGRVPHLIEIKILRGAFTGAAQLATYMEAEGRSEGWLVIFDTRTPARKTHIPDVISVPEGLIRVVVVDVNPVIPSRKK